MVTVFFFVLFATLVVATQQSYRTYDFFSFKHEQLIKFYLPHTSLFEKEIWNWYEDHGALILTE